MFLPSLLSSGLWRQIVWYRNVRQTFIISAINTFVRKVYKFSPDFTVSQSIKITLALREAEIPNTVHCFKYALKSLWQLSNWNFKNLLHEIQLHVRGEILLGWSRNCAQTIKFESLLLCSQHVTVGHYPKPVKSSSSHSSQFYNINVNMLWHLSQILQNCNFSLGFFTKILCGFLSYAIPLSSHLPSLNFTLFCVRGLLVR